MAPRKGAPVASPAEPETPAVDVPAENIITIPAKTSNSITVANGTSQLPAYLLKWAQTLEALRNPFNPDDIYFLPQTVNYRDNTAIAAAYADSRVYTTRLNEVIGAGFWQSEVVRVDMAAFTKVIKAKLDWKDKDAQGNAKVLEPARDVSGHKVGIVARVGIWMGPVLGWVYQDSVGGKDTADENWNTSAEAQAYKRAMSKWGPGEYLYHFGKQSCGYDVKKGQWKQTPTIPDWAYPSHNCSDCPNVIEHYTYKDREGNTQSRHFWDIVVSTRQKYGRPLCPVCAKKAQLAATPADVQQRLQ